jgi:ketosteroid isomerase-like protein
MVCTDDPSIVRGFSPLASSLGETPCSNATTEEWSMKSLVAAIGTISVAILGSGAFSVTLASEDQSEQSEATVNNEPPAEIKALIQAHIEGFNTQDNEMLLSVFGDTAIVVDGIAPYRWIGPDGPAKWVADVEKWRKDLGVTYEHFEYTLLFWNVEGTAAYAVVDGKLTVTAKGQTGVRTGTLAYTFSKASGVWKIEAQAWGRTS